MIPELAITQWRSVVPWSDVEQVEQDLIICRALVAIFSDEFLAERLAFRGGTALHKYMKWEGKNPTYKLYVSNMEDKMKKAEFLGDTKTLLRPGEVYDAQEAYKVVKEKIINNLATEEELDQEIITE